MIGFHRRTQEVGINCFLIVACYMLDMVVLPLMIGMNLVEMDFLASIFKGRYTDFGAGWYTEVGRQIATTMTIFAFQPLIDFIVEYLTVSLT